MMKFAMLCLLAVAAASIAAGIHSEPVLVFSPDIPPPSCAPNCPLAR